MLFWMWPAAEITRELVGLVYIYTSASTEQLDKHLSRSTNFSKFEAMSNRVYNPGCMWEICELENDPAQSEWGNILKYHEHVNRNPNSRIIWSHNLTLSTE